MATQLFNYTSQKLSAERLRQINSFNSYNFAGVIGKKSPIEFDEYDVTIKASEESPVILMGGGLLIMETSEIAFNLPSVGWLAYIKVTLDPELGTVVTDEYSGIEYDKANCNYYQLKQQYTIYSVVDILGEDDNPSLLSYYEYEDGTYTLSTDETVDQEKTYYIKYESDVFAFRAPDKFGNTIYTYNGNTIWISDNEFIIPIALKTTDGIKLIISLKDLRDLEGFLSLESYAKLKKYCEGTFVWTVGGLEEVEAPDGTVHKKGDIGSLNVTDNLISNNIDDEPVAVESLQIQNLNNSSPDDRLYVDNFGNLCTDSDYKTPVDRGGTYLENSWDETKPRYSAKQNLGIYYGTLDPNNTFPVSQPVEGDIYLKIIDNEE